MSSLWISFWLWKTNVPLKLKENTFCKDNSQETAWLLLKNCSRSKSSCINSVLIKSAFPPAMLSVSAGPKLWNMVIVNRTRITGNLTVSLIKMVVAICEKNEAENNLLGKKKKKILDLLICAAQNSCSWYSCWTSLTTGAGGFFARKWQNPYREKVTQEKPQVCIFSVLAREAANTVHGVLQTHCKLKRPVPLQQKDI